MEMTVSKELFPKVAKVIETQETEEISFSFVIGSLFPKAWENIQKELCAEHMRGYLERKNEELVNDDI